MTTKQKYQEILEDNNELRAILGVISKDSSGYTKSIQRGTPVTITEGNTVYRIKDGKKQSIGTTRKNIKITTTTIKTNF